MVGYDPSPDVAMFKRFKDVFPNIDTSGSYMTFDLDNKDELIELLAMGHPDFPEVTGNTELWDLITAKSWQFFAIVKSGDPKWLMQPVSEWDTDPDYREIRGFVSTVKVVNDSCERAVALVTDYARILTKDSSIRRKILQVVEADRKAFKDCNKATLDK